MTITIKTIPHKNQRYDTVGDWTYSPETDSLLILVSDMGNRDYEMLVAIHELTEATLCIKAGITTEMVDSFDMGPIGSELDDPGNDARAPYHYQHLIATEVEAMLASELRVDWDAYDQAVLKMGVEESPTPKTPETSSGLD